MNLSFVMRRENDGKNNLIQCPQLPLIGSFTFKNDTSIFEENCKNNRQIYIIPQYDGSYISYILQFIIIIENINVPLF